MKCVFAFATASLLALFVLIGPRARICAAALNCDTLVAQPRPIALGVSGGNLNSIGRGYCSTGTLGSLVEIGSSQYILSNSHVIATQNASQVVIQPGLVDSFPTCFAGLGQEVAEGVNFIGISPATPNVIDAAVAKVIDGDVDSSGRILNIGKIAAGGAIPPTLNLLVEKMGRTTCLRRGLITALDVTINVEYPRCCNLPFKGIATFTRQIEIQPGTFSASGDSGSLVVTQGSCPGAVGLLFAGSPNATFANPMHAVLQRFNATMVGKACTPTLSWHDDVLASATDQSPAVQAREVADATAVKRRHEAELLKVPGVIGSGVGLSADGKPVIKVFVKKETSAMHSSIPSSLEGIPVEIEETGPVTAY
jgi:hypothetical protein